MTYVRMYVRNLQHVVSKLRIATWYYHHLHFVRNVLRGSQQVNRTKTWGGISVPSDENLITRLVPLKPPLFGFINACHLGSQFAIKKWSQVQRYGLCFST